MNEQQWTKNSSLSSSFFVSLKLIARMVLMCLCAHIFLCSLMPLNISSILSSPRVARNQRKFNFIERHCLSKLLSSFNAWGWRVTPSHHITRDPGFRGQRKVKENLITTQKSHSWCALSKFLPFPSNFAQFRGKCVKAETIQKQTENLINFIVWWWSFICGIINEKWLWKYVVVLLLFQFCDELVKCLL